MKLYKLKNSNVLEKNPKLNYYLIFDDEDSEYILTIKSKYFRFVIYWYTDNCTECILSDVKVKSFYRKIGYGNLLLIKAIQIAKERGFETMCLRVLKDSWMYDWYKRNGFNYHSHFGDYVWMIKNLK